MRERSAWRRKFFLSSACFAQGSRWRFGSLLSDFLEQLRFLVI
jgi:hypothetical protein